MSFMVQIALLRKLSETAHKVDIYSWVSEEMSTRVWGLEPPAVNPLVV